MFLGFGFSLLMLLPFVAAQPQGWVCPVLLLNQQTFSTCLRSWARSFVLTALPWSAVLSPAHPSPLACSLQGVWI